jgi:hypothetical protein
MQQRLDAIAGRKSANVIDAWHIGTRLVAVKAKLAHGNFLPWLSEHLPSITRQTASIYMRVAESNDTAAEAEEHGSIARAANGKHFTFDDAFSERITQAVSERMNAPWIRLDEDLVAFLRLCGVMDYWYLDYEGVVLFALQNTSQRVFDAEAHEATKKFRGKARQVMLTPWLQWRDDHHRQDVPDPSGMVRVGHWINTGHMIEPVTLSNFAF